MDDDDIWAKLAAIEQAIAKKTIFYVYYNSAGMIIHVRNELIEDNEYPFIEVTEDEARNLDPRHNVDFDSLYVLQNSDGASIARKVNKIEDYFQISSQIYRIPKGIKDNDFRYSDLSIEQDKEKSKFIIRMSQDSSVRSYHKHERFKDKIFNLYLTDVLDPHVLYETISVNICDLAHNGVYFYEMLDNKVKDVDIYTTPIFKTYTHVFR